MRAPTISSKVTEELKKTWNRRLGTPRYLTVNRFYARFDTNNTDIPTKAPWDPENAAVQVTHTGPKGSEADASSEGNWFRWRFT